MQTRELTTTYRYDELGRRIETTDAAGGITRSVFDGRGNVVAAIEGGGSAVERVTLAAYDGQDRKN